MTAIHRSSKRLDQYQYLHLEAKEARSEQGHPIEKLLQAFFFYTKLMKSAQTYSIIGGMPEIVEKHSPRKDIIAINYVFESLIVFYLDDLKGTILSQGRILGMIRCKTLG